MSPLFITEEHSVCNGKVKIIKTTQSNQVWQMRFWISNEGKYFRKSLRENNLEIAKEKARQIFYKIMGQVESGVRIFSITAKELVERYLEHQSQRVSGGFITAERKQTIESYSKRFIEFVGGNTKLDNIPRQKYKEYYSFRKNNSPAIQHSSLINEKTTIGSFYKWGLEKNYITHLTSREYLYHILC
jgi:hypothetical protein